MQALMIGVDIFTNPTKKHKFMCVASWESLLLDETQNRSARLCGALTFYWLQIRFHMDFIMLIRKRKLFMRWLVWVFNVSSSTKCTRHFTSCSRIKIIIKLYNVHSDICKYNVYKISLWLSITIILHFTFVSVTYRWYIWAIYHKKTLFPLLQNANITDNYVCITSY